ncbi:MAG: hypothetical protein JXR66_07975 [Bacteroidales bacterium]|nr:hypothetical protein [Bacteroidales bacterium]
MISYLHHDEIDRERWDNCLNYLPRVRPYAFSWYLDIMAPGWEAMVDDDYDAIFPIPCSSKFGIRYIATPIFLQQLGAFSPDKNPYGVINDFFDYMPEFYRFIDLATGQDIVSDDYRVTARSNYELDLSRPYEILRKNFTPHCVRNIEKAIKNSPAIDNDITPSELIALFRSNRGASIKGIKQRDYDRLEKLMSFCLINGRGRIIGVRSSGKQVIYGNFLVETSGRITMLFVVNTSVSRNKRTGYYVVNEIIRNYAETDTILDFAGSSLPPVASFMESFGSVKVPFYRIYRNRLPFFIRFLK